MFPYLFLVKLFTGIRNLLVIYKDIWHLTCDQKILFTNIWKLFNVPTVDCAVNRCKYKFLQNIMSSTNVLCVMCRSFAEREPKTIDKF